MPRIRHLPLLVAVALGVPFTHPAWGADGGVEAMPPEPAAAAEWFDERETEEARAPDSPAMPPARGLSDPPAPAAASQTDGELPPASGSMPLAPTSGTWVAQGPGPVIGGQVTNLAPDDRVVGAVHTVLADPTDPDVLIIGAVNGGIWRTTNAGSPNPSWTPLIDDFPALSIAALERDPGDPDVLFAGIGRYSSFAGRGGRRTGALLSLDGGESWTEIRDDLLFGRDVSGVAVRGNTLLVSMRSFFVAGSPLMGLFRSTDRGESWTQISGDGISGLPPGSVWDLAGDPTDPTRLYASVARTGIFMSTDTGATWTNISSGDPALSSVIQSANNNNAEFSVSPVNGRVYVAVLVAGQARYIGYSDDQGASWIEMDLPALRRLGNITDASNESPIVVTSEGHGLRASDTVTVTGVLGNTAANGTFPVAVLDDDSFSLTGSTGNGVYEGGGTFFNDDTLNPRFKPGGQGGIHFSILADHSDVDVVYVGGDRQDSPFPNVIGADDFTGNLWRGNASIPRGGPEAVPSPQWEHLTDSAAVASIPGGGTANGTAPHADSREMVFDAAGDIIEVNDGGIVRRSNPGSNTGDWVSLVGDLQITEQHDVAYDTVADVLISGNQDTGTTEQTAPGSTTWRTVSTADGGDVQVDAKTLPGMSIRYSSNQFFALFRRRICDAANVCGESVFPALNVTAGDPLPIGAFVTPLALHRIDPTRLLIGFGTGLYESFDQGDNIAQVPDTGFTNENALYYGHADDPDFIAVGGLFNVLTRTGGAGSPITDTGGPGTGYVRDVTVDPSDMMRIFAIDDQRHVQYSPDGGATWIDVTGDLTGPARAFASLEYLPNGVDTDRLVLGTNLGVYLMPLNALGHWFQLATGIPSSVVWDMEYDPADDLLAAGTLGRGAWTLSSASTVQIPPVALCQSFSRRGLIEVADFDAGSFDPDGGAVELSVSPPLPFPLGDTPFTLTVTDDEGTSSTCTGTARRVNQNCGLGSELCLIWLLLRRRLARRR